MNPPEMTMKAWRLETAQRLSVTESAVAMWLTRGKLHPVLRRENPKIVFVLSPIPEERPRRKKYRAYGSTGLSRKLLGNAEYLRRWRQLEKKK